MDGATTIDWSERRSCTDSNLIEFHFRKACLYGNLCQQRTTSLSEAWGRQIQGQKSLIVKQTGLLLNSYAY